MADTKFGGANNSHNPGGLTREARAARELLRATLNSTEMLMAWKKAYLNQLIAENGLIIKDYADRIGGKPKESVEIVGDVNLVVTEVAERIAKMSDDQILEMYSKDK